VDGGVTSEDAFLSGEGSRNTAGLWATFEFVPNQVPIPAPLALFGIGLLGLAWQHKRKA
jgi:hypothetical protein